MMLPNINLLYLFCRVLILLDGSYMSRFWTQFEAFLSFRKVTASGLGPTPLSERRDAIICIHNADSEFDPPKLRKMWGEKTADEAHAVLARPDVTVTNQRDKDVQLPKLQKLDEFAKSVLADVVSVSEARAVGDLLTYQAVLCPGRSRGTVGRLHCPSPQVLRSIALRSRRSRGGPRAEEGLRQEEVRPEETLN